MIKLDYAYLAVGRMTPHGRILGGSSISTKVHDIFYCPERHAIAVYWEKKHRPFYISANVVDSWREAAEFVDKPIFQYDEAAKKRGPGRPKGSKNKK